MYISCVGDSMVYVRGLCSAGGGDVFGRDILGGAFVVKVI